MIFETLGNKNKPAILFFHAMGVVGKSSERVAKNLEDKYFCIMPTSTVYCKDQKYISKEDEVKQVEIFLKENNIKKLELVVASSIGADLALAFIASTKISINHIFFDGGQFAQINKPLRRIMSPLFYWIIRSLYKKNGENLKKIMWCDDKEIRPYFIEAGKNLTYKNMKKQLSDSLENKPFPPIKEELQKHTFFEFGSAEDHFKYRDNVIKAYPYVNYPIFEGYNHMEYQIRDPKGFANMLESIIEKNKMPNLPFMK